MEPPDFGRDDEFWGWHRAADVIVGVDGAALLINLMMKKYYWFFGSIPWMASSIMRTGRVSRTVRALVSVRPPG